MRDEYRETGFQRKEDGKREATKLLFSRTWNLSSDTFRRSYPELGV
jgi:hypothetical protein